MTTERTDLAAIKARADAAMGPHGPSPDAFDRFVNALHASAKDVHPLLAEVADLRAKCERVAALLFELDVEAADLALAWGTGTRDTRIGLVANRLRAALVGDDHTGPPE